jgi:hypothetical protein
MFSLNERYKDGLMTAGSAHFNPDKAVAKMARGEPLRGTLCRTGFLVRRH